MAILLIRRNDDHACFPFDSDGAEQVVGPSVDVHLPVAMNVKRRPLGDDPHPQAIEDLAQGDAAIWHALFAAMLCQPDVTAVGRKLSYQPLGVGPCQPLRLPIGPSHPTHKYYGLSREAIPLTLTQCS